MNSPIILTTHNRDIYLRLTLNSLLYSLKEEPQVLIHIIMIAPTTEVELVCREYQNNSSQIRLYKIYENVGCLLSINLILQYLKPTIFTLWEEDFILPQHTSKVLPHWNSEFCNQLNQNNQLVSFLTSIENVASDLFVVFNSLHPFPGLLPNKFMWLTNIPKDTITGNSMTVSFNTWKLAAKWLQNTKWKMPFPVASDHAIYSVAKIKKYASIVGYHIGANQEMDGFDKIMLNKHKMCETQKTFTIYDLNNHQSKEIDPHNIWNQ